jgi:hypothetical protein
MSATHMDPPMAIAVGMQTSSGIPVWRWLQQTPVHHALPLK